MWFESLLVFIFNESLLKNICDDERRLVTLFILFFVESFEELQRRRKRK